MRTRRLPHRPLAGLAAALALVAAGCGGDSGSSSAPPPGPAATPVAQAAPSDKQLDRSFVRRANRLCKRFERRSKRYERLLKHSPQTKQEALHFLEGAGEVAGMAEDFVLRLEELTAPASKDQLFDAYLDTGDATIQALQSLVSSVRGGNPERFLVLVRRLDRLDAKAERQGKRLGLGSCEK